MRRSGARAIVFAIAAASPLLASCALLLDWDLSGDGAVISDASPEAEASAPIPEASPDAPQPTSPRACPGDADGGVLVICDAFERAEPIASPFQRIAPPAGDVTITRDLSWVATGAQALRVAPSDANPDGPLLVAENVTLPRPGRAIQVTFTIRIDYDAAGFTGERTLAVITAGSSLAATDDGVVRLLLAGGEAVLLASTFDGSGMPYRRSVGMLTPGWHDVVLWVKFDPFGRLRLGVGPQGARDMKFPYALFDTSTETGTDAPATSPLNGPTVASFGFGASGSGAPVVVSLDDIHVSN